MRHTQQTCYKPVHLSWTWPSVISPMTEVSCHILSHFISAVTRVFPEKRGGSVTNYLYKFHRCQSYSSFRQMGRGRSGGCWAPRAPVRQQTASWITTGRFVSLSEGLSSYDDTLVNSAEALQSISQMQCPQPSNKGSEWEEDLHG